jgi:cell wall-associated NlpC family hydrolase
MVITKLSVTASSFPTLEVEYEDLLSLRYLVDGRYGGAGIDCIGVVMEVYRRAGLGLPDPAVAGGHVIAFAALFEQLVTPATLDLYDLINIRRESNHVAVVVRPGLALSARERAGVYAVRVNNLKSISGVAFYRVRTAALPV